MVTFCRYFLGWNKINEFDDSLHNDVRGYPRPEMKHDQRNLRVNGSMDVDRSFRDRSFSRVLCLHFPRHVTDNRASLMFSKIGTRSVRNLYQWFVLFRSS